jgi:hypothetical protein
MLEYDRGSYPIMLLGVERERERERTKRERERGRPFVEVERLLMKRVVLV